MARPLKYKTTRQMQDLIDSYFDACITNKKAESIDLAQFEELPEDVKEKIEAAEKVTLDTIPTVSGLAVVLDLTRQGLINYEGKPAFVDTVKRAKQRIEAFSEQRLHHGSAVGMIFSLKNNFGWKDKTEQEIGNLEGQAFKTDNKWEVEFINPSDEHISQVQEEASKVRGESA